MVFGINHEMRDFKVNRKKDLDLVLCTPSRDPDGSTLAGLVDDWKLDLNEVERKKLKSLPTLYRAPVGAVQIALEAKACMTEHVKALPRLYDELNSSHLTIHGAMDVAIAVGFVMVNFSKTFISPGRNKHDLSKVTPKVTNHPQPKAAERAIGKVMEISRRKGPGEDGFDAVGIVGIDCSNDNSPVTIVTAPPAPSLQDVAHYDQMIRRVVQLYETRFRTF
ncbi:MAG TPA: hypothetical protein VHO25_21905 [Polyangiaceae bacterium]|nr:hypothetical protein [Polyangiaceae bacterium]